MKHHDPLPELKPNTIASVEYVTDEGCYIERGRVRRQGHSVKVGRVRFGHTGIRLSDVVKVYA